MASGSQTARTPRRPIKTPGSPRPGSVTSRGRGRSLSPRPGTAVSRASRASSKTSKRSRKGKKGRRSKSPRPNPDITRAGNLIALLARLKMRHPMTPTKGPSLLEQIEKEGAACGFSATQMWELRAVMGAVMQANLHMFAKLKD